MYQQHRKIIHDTNLIHVIKFIKKIFKYLYVFLDNTNYVHM